MAIQNYLTLSHLRKAVTSITQKIISDLAGLTDTLITSPTNGQALLYDSTSSKWKNGTLPPISPVMVNVTDSNTATVLTCNKGFTDILTLQSSGNSIIAYVNCSTITSGQYQLISTISEYDLDTDTTTNKAVFSNGKEKIYVTDSQYPSTAPSGIANMYKCEVEYTTTYSLSLTSNELTLTGSDGTTSSVTLPVYNGGVSS